MPFHLTHVWVRFLLNFIMFIDIAFPSYSEVGVKRNQEKVIIYFMNTHYGLTSFTNFSTVLLVLTSKSLVVSFMMPITNPFPKRNVASCTFHVQITVFVWSIGLLVGYNETQPDLLSTLWILSLHTSMRLVWFEWIINTNWWEKHSA